MSVNSTRSRMASSRSRLVSASAARAASRSRSVRASLAAMPHSTSPVSKHSPCCGPRPERGGNLGRPQTSHVSSLILCPSSTATCGLDAHDDEVVGHAVAADQDVGHANVETRVFLVVAGEVVAPRRVPLSQAQDVAHGEAPVVASVLEALASVADCVERLGPAFQLVDSFAHSPPPVRVASARLALTSAAVSYTHLRA